MSNEQLFQLLWFSFAFFLGAVSSWAFTWAKLSSAFWGSIL